MKVLSSKDIVDIIKAGHEAKLAKLAMNGLVIEYQPGEYTPIFPVTTSIPDEQEAIQKAEVLKPDDIPTEELMYLDPVAYEQRLAMEG